MLDAKRFVWFHLALFLLATVRSAHAHDEVAQDHNYLSAQNSATAACVGSWGAGYDALELSRTTSTMTFWCHNISTGFTQGYFSLGVPLECPDHSFYLFDSPCVCNANYHANDTHKLCVENCPAHASGAPCVCDVGYQFDAAGTSCIPEQYAISLSGLGGEVMPTKTRDAYALVTGSDGSAKSGEQVSLSLDVVPELEGQLPVSYTGTLNAYAGATGADGRLNFVFTAPVAGGTHTISATCTNCTNEATGTIKVPGCSVESLTDLDKLSALVGETPEQADLTKKLEDGMDGYSLLSPATQAAEQCLAGRVSAVVGSPSTSGYKVTSTIRTLAYQKHLREVWDKFRELKRKVDDDPTIQQRCQALITEVEGEMGFRLTQKPTDKNESCSTALSRAHCVRYPPAKADPKHIQNIAFDIPQMTVWKFELVLWLNEMLNSTVQKEANTCGLNWGGTFGSPDPIHFQLQ